MTRILFVSNGHGEEAIAARIADEVAALVPEATLDHLALVGEFGHPSRMHEVGPRRAMPSGGLIAMGNARNIVRDVRGGLIGLTAAQLRFLRGARGSYEIAVAVGDTFAAIMTLQMRAPTIFVGTAKSAYVAPYGPFEARVLRKARAVFVRDEATARGLRTRNVSAEAPGNTIVDLFAAPDDSRADAAFTGFDPGIALFPGSRASAYNDAPVLARTIRELAATRRELGAVLSIAPGLRADALAHAFERDGWTLRARDDERIPFSLLYQDRELVRAWQGDIAALLARARLVVGQAGTANEAAAAAGVPVVALRLAADKKAAWYRRRQRGLLGDALLVVPGDPALAAGDIGALLDDSARRERMAQIGRERMGLPGGASAVAHRVAALAGAAA